MGPAGAMPSRAEGIDAEHRRAIRRIQGHSLHAHLRAAQGRQVLHHGLRRIASNPRVGL